MDGKIKTGEWDKLYPPPFTLFQAENGKWGTKDANGQVYDKPVYNRVERDGEVIFNNGFDEACSFNPQTGMDIIFFGEPWWVAPFDVFNFHEEYTGYILENLKQCHEMPSNEIREHITWLLQNVELDEDKRHALNGLLMELRWDEADDDTYEAIESEWFELYPDDRDGQRRINTLTQLMERDDIPEKCKSAVWYTNFKFVNNFCM